MLSRFKSTALGALSSRIRTVSGITLVAFLPKATRPNGFITVVARSGLAIDATSATSVAHRNPQRDVGPPQLAVSFIFGMDHGSKPTCSPIQPGCCSVAPLVPQMVHRADRRSLSLDVSAPQRMISGANAIGA